MLVNKFADKKNLPMKHLLLSISFFSSILFPLQAQIIEGTVYDAKTRETIPGVYIFLDGTSISTTSDKDGYFKLEVQRINANLIFRHLSYESLSVEQPFELRQTTFFLKEKAHTLGEAKVVAERQRYSRRQMMKVFKDQFLGRSTAGVSCKILNEDDLVFKYDEAKCQLLAYSNNPLMIENNHLAYRLTYDLHSFTVQYKINSIYDTDIEQILISGTSSFADSKPYNPMFEARREKIYYRSRQYFWKNFVENTLKVNGFKIFNDSKEIELHPYFTITDIEDAYIVQVNVKSNLRKSHHRLPGKAVGIIFVDYSNKYASEVIFMTDEFSVDKFGNTNVVGLFYTGDMETQRIGDALPLDYLPVAPSSVK